PLRRRSFPPFTDRPEAARKTPIARYVPPPPQARVLIEPPFAHLDAPRCPVGLRARRMKGGKTSSAQRWMHRAAASRTCAPFAPVEHAALAAVCLARGDGRWRPPN
ncbi:MAG TPA: hypothetical protein VGX78_11140, partial [Pirellulales bacterium]|nr:hypothetical protein [Pirellulales bacterium]